MKKIFIYWLYSAVIVTLVCGLMYAVLRQNYRVSADDQLVQISQDLSSAMAAGEPPQDLGNPTFDLGQNLSPFVAVYDSSGKALAYTAVLDGKAPELPSGAFSTAKKKGEDRFTWQPKSGVRIAAVVTYFGSDANKNSGFVLAGRSLKEVERSETNLAYTVSIGWALILVVSFLLLWLFGRFAAFRTAGAGASTGNVIGSGKVQEFTDSNDQEMNPD